MYVYTYIYMCTYLYMHIPIYTHLHTYIHIHTYIYMYCQKGQTKWPKQNGQNEKHKKGQKSRFPVQILQKKFWCQVSFLTFILDA